jgi:hypothetical protein
MPLFGPTYTLSWPRIRSMDVKTRTASRVEASVPKPNQVKRMSEEEKHALELSGEIEHEHGEAREETAREAQNSKTPRHGNVKVRR